MNSVNKFKARDRVKLSRLCPYTPAPSNPVEGSKYACMGTIIETSTGSGRTYVNWDNGKGNSYNIKDLLKSDHINGHKLTKIFK